MDTKTTVDWDVGCRVAPLPDTSFFMIGDQRAVFCLPHQKIYGLNDTAAFIWCHLEDGRGADAICNAMADAGVDPRTAAKYVRGAIEKWLRIGLLKPQYVGEAHILPVQTTITLKAADYKVSLQIANERLARMLLPMFEHLCVPEGAQNEILSVVEIGALVHVLLGDTNLFCCSIDELAPSVLSHVIDRALETCTRHLIFHSACLVRGEKSLLISGRSGAGKSTLTLRLLHAGFEYGGDDIAIISAAGARGLPFAPGAKAGAWDLIKQFRPDLDSHTIHRRHDNKRIRYLKPSPVAAERSRPIGWFVFLRRTANGPAKLTPIGPMDLVNRIIGGAIYPSPTLTLTVLDAIKRAMAGAAGFELAYSDLDDASEALRQLCHD
jgi:Coenzyme PQQ synthesis protein D (PqqD)